MWDHSAVTHVSALRCGHRLQRLSGSTAWLSEARRQISGIAVGRTRHAVHAGQSLWGPDEPCVGKRGALLESLLQPCYATASDCSRLALQRQKVCYRSCCMSGCVHHHHRNARKLAAAVFVHMLLLHASVY